MKLVDTFLLPPGLKNKLVKGEFVLIKRHSLLEILHSLRKDPRKLLAGVLKLQIKVYMNTIDASPLFLFELGYVSYATTYA